MNKSLLSAIAMMLCLVAVASDADAVSRRKLCKRQCGPAISAQCPSVGRQHRVCKRKLLKTCRRVSLEACSLTPTTSTTVVTVTSTTTSPTTVVTTTTTSTTTTSTTLTPKTVFITSAIVTGDLGGIAGADALCNDLASASSLPGTYKAWLSDSASSPATTFTKDHRYLLPDGTTLVANSWADLTDGTLVNDITQTESGGEVTNVLVMTNTYADGTAVPNGACQDFTSAAEEEAVGLGINVLSDSNWTSYATGGCTNSFYSYRLYCFEQ
ncbi:MAG: DUF1554 domain-containing protein [bacterium]|nr:DUF1554 domain-containing protein [bacterium]